MNKFRQAELSRAGLPTTSLPAKARQSAVAHQGKAKSDRLKKIAVGKKPPAKVNLLTQHHAPHN